MPNITRVGAQFRKNTVMFDGGGLNVHEWVLHSQSHERLTTHDEIILLRLSLKLHTGLGLLRFNNCALLPRVPQIEGLLVHSRDEDPRRNSLRKQLLFKPPHASEAADDQRVPLIPFEAIYKHSAPAGKWQKVGPDRNPCDTFRETLLFY